MKYEFDGETYAKASAHQTEWGMQIASELELDGNEHLIDIGCGDGRITRALAFRVPRGRVIGVDSSPGMISTAKQYETANLRFTTLDANDLAYEGEFDVVFSHATLHWIKNHTALLQCVHAALRKPKGYARLNFAGKGTAAILLSILEDTTSESEYSPYFSEMEPPWFMPSEEEYRVLLAASSFGSFHLRKQIFTRHFPDKEALVKWIDHPMLVPFLAVLPKDKHAAFREAVLQRTVAATRQKDGRYCESFSRLDIWATA